MYDDIVEAVLKDVAIRMLDDGCHYSTISKYTKLTSTEISKIEEEVNFEREREVAHEKFIAEITEILRDYIMNDKSEGLNDQIKALCDKRNEIIPIGEIRNTIKILTKEKAQLERDKIMQSSATD